MPTRRPQRFARTSVAMLLLMLAVCLGCTDAAAHDTDLMTGQRHYFNGDYQKAVQYFQKAVSRNPGPVAHYHLALAYYKLKDYQRARASFLSALRLKPDYVSARLYLARTCLELRDLDCVREHLEFLDKSSSRELEPEDRLVMRQLGAKMWYEKGNASFEANDYQEAVRCYRQAIGLDDSFPPLYHNLAMALMNLKQNREAVDHFKRYLELRPDAKNAAEIRKIIKQLSK